MNKHYIKSAFVALFLSVSLGLYSQNTAFNVAGNPSTNPAIVDLSDASNANLGFLMPNVHLASITDVTTIPSAATGLIVWNTNASMPNGVGFYYWSGTAWLYVMNSGTPSVSGSGTANYMARWTAPTTLGTGVAQDNGSGVSISSTALTPANMLDVKGNAAFGTYAGTAAPTNGMIVSGQMGIGTIAPNASAALDITSTTGGLLPPRMTTAQITAIATPATGLTVLNSTTGCLEYYNGTTWQNMVCPCTGVPNAGSITGNATPCESTTGNVYSISAVAGATNYTWTVPTGATITAGQNTTSITVTMGTTNGNITVTASNSCGTGATQSLALTMLSIPVAPAIPSGTTSPGLSSSYTYTIATVSGATSYTWSSSNTNLGTVTAGQGTTSATITTTATAGTFTICVYASNPCGNSATSCLTVTSVACTHSSVTFTYSASIQTWTVPGCISQVTVTAAGGGGGSSSTCSGCGGKGALIVGVITVTGGHVLNIVTGGAGTTNTTDDGGAGGGGSFIWDNTSNTLLEVAGGGGGCYYTTYDGYNGSTTTTPTGTNGGTAEGGGGSIATDAGGGGAGFLGNGSTDGGTECGLGGNDKANAFTGGAGDSGYDATISGGYGGGGGAGYDDGGGGGGYNGGGSGSEDGGGGGGSYVNGTTSSATTTPTSANGYVTINY